MVLKPALGVFSNLKKLHAKSAIVGSLLAVSLFVSSCSTNPATGQKQFTALMPASQEAQIGAQEHKKIIKEFGVVKDTKLQSLIDKIGARIVPYTERSDVNYTFTILDTNIVNAFALPGGYVYVSRGLMALANSEDELAAVIAHEIGHVTARHSAERYSRGTVAGLGAGILGILLESKQATELLGLGSNLYLASYSRTQEHEADFLGIRYITKAGYDPDAMSDFLVSLERETQLMQKRLGVHAKNQNSYMSTHPVTAERVSKTKLEASQAGRPDNVRIGRERESYLAAVNGMVYGDSPKQGFEYKGKFVHPEMGFSFNMPDGYVLKNSASNIVMLSPKNYAIAIMDGGKLPAGANLLDYMVKGWQKQQKLVNVETRNINGRNAVLAQYPKAIKGQRGNVFVAVIQWEGGQLFRFQIAIPSNIPAGEQKQLLDIVTSFDALSAREKAKAKPKKLVTVRSSGIGSPEKLAQKLPYDDDLNELRSRVLNGLSSSDRISSGEIYKTIVQ
jgi:predicted Zn-dependent protease